MIEQTDGSSTEYSAEWLSANHTTPEEQEALAWRDERTRDVEASSKLKTALNIDHEAYRKQIEGLDPAWRQELADKPAEEVVEILDELADDERDLKRLEGDLEKADADRQEATLAARETEHQVTLRKRYTQAAKDVATLDERIAELQRMNALRDDPTDEGWNEMPMEQWVAAREGKLDGWNQEISNLVQEKQAKLQEAALYQDGYHEANRATQPAPPQPIGHFQGMPLNHGDIQLMVQMERDEQAHQQRATEARSRYVDWDQAFRGIGDLPMRNDHMAFVKSLPNSADVAYYLATHPNEAMELVQMPNTDATRTLINISHKAKPTQEERKTTKAPKPPSPVGGGSSRTFDVYDESLSNDEWFRMRNADLKRQGRL